MKKKVIHPKSKVSAADLFDFAELDFSARILRHQQLAQFIQQEFFCRNNIKFMFHDTFFILRIIVFA